MKKFNIKFEIEDRAIYQGEIEIEAETEAEAISRFKDKFTLNHLVDYYTYDSPEYYLSDYEVYKSNPFCVLLEPEPENPNQLLMEGIINDSRKI